MLSQGMPDLMTLQLIVAIRATGSLGSAGAEAGMTQQAVSLRVRALERRVGVTLIARGPRGSRLTDAGRLVAEWADGVIEAAARMDAGIAALRADRAVHLDLAASLTIAEHLVPRWLIGLRDRRAAAGDPPAQVRLQPVNSDAVVDAVRAGRAGLGFVEGPDAPRGLRSRVVARDRLVVAVAPTHPWARRRTVPAVELAETPLVSRESGSGTRQALHRVLGAHLPPRCALAAPALEVPSGAAARACLVAGLAPGALSHLVLADDLAMGRLVAIDVLDADGSPLVMTRPLRAVWPGPDGPAPGPARDLVAVASLGRPARPARPPRPAGPASSARPAPQG